MKNYALLFLFLCSVNAAWAQTGISVSPPRLYFETEPGKSVTDRITVTNVSVKNSLDLAVSLGDWAYDEKGENITHPAKTLPSSCAGWLTVKKEDTYMSLAPGEKKEIEITLTVPEKKTDNLQTHTALFYITQMNPVNDVDSKGANIKVSIRSGIKVFHHYPSGNLRKLEMDDLKYMAESGSLLVTFSNTGNTWADGKMFADLINTGTGKKTVIEPVVFYTMPGNRRQMQLQLPPALEKGSYTASVMLDYGEADALEVGELNFTK